MKKILFIAALASTSTSLVGQSNKVVSAYSYHQHYLKDKDVEELLQAVENIEPATIHEKTMSDPKTWFYRGNIFSSIHESKSDNEKLKELKLTSINEAYKSYMKSLDLDTKKEYAPDVKQRLGTVLSQIVNQGINFYNEKKYSDALGSFENALSINNYFKRVDTLVIYNAALAAEKSVQLDKAVNYFQELIKLKYGQGKTYSYLANIYKTQKNDAKALEMVKEGRAAYPNDKGLIIEELNNYLAQGKFQEAINNLNLAIKDDPNNHILHFSLGTLYDNLANPDKSKTQPTDAVYADYMTKSEASYKKSLEIKADYFDATYNLGALYFNQAVKINDKSNNIKDDKLYQIEVKKADEKFSVCLPYLEKALELNATDKNTLLSLKQLYARTGQTEKYKKIKEQLEN